MASIAQPQPGVVPSYATHVVPPYEYEQAAVVAESYNAKANKMLKPSRCLKNLVGRRRTVTVQSLVDALVRALDVLSSRVALNTMPNAQSEVEVINPDTASAIPDHLEGSAAHYAVPMTIEMVNTLLIVLRGLHTYNPRVVVAGQLVDATPANGVLHHPGFNNSRIILLVHGTDLVLFYSLSSVFASQQTRCANASTSLEGCAPPK